jgi:hypothetical protein
VSWDPAHAPDAERRRTEKAVTLARWCWFRGVGPGTVAAWSEGVRREAARAVGVNPPHDDTTWALVRTGLTRWAAEHPVPTVNPRLHQRWCDGCERGDLH